MDIITQHIERLTRASSLSERRRLERQVKTGIMVSPMRGIFADAKEWEKTSPRERERQLLATLSDIHESWAFCLFSAAIIYGLEVGREELIVIHRQALDQSRITCSGRILKHKCREISTYSVDGIRVTPPIQTVVDCLCLLKFDRALAIADSAMRILGVTKDALNDELASRGECAGWRTARDAIKYADPRSANGGESVARAIMIEQGFSIPQLQVEIHDQLDATTYFVDYCWDLGNQQFVIGELDGKDKYILPEMTGGRDVVDVMRDERLRESRISMKGARVMRFSYRDVMNTERFTRMLELYGVPRGAARPIGE